MRQAMFVVRFEYDQRTPCLLVAEVFSYHHLNFSTSCLDKKKRQATKREFFTCLLFLKANCVKTKSKNRWQFIDLAPFVWSQRNSFFCDGLVGYADLFMHGKKLATLKFNFATTLMCVVSGQPSPNAPLSSHSPNLVTNVLKRRSFLNAGHGHEWQIFTYQLDWRRFCISGFGVTKITHKGLWSPMHKYFTTWLSIMVNFWLQGTVLDIKNEK